MKLLKLATCITAASLLVACGSDSKDTSTTAAPFSQDNAQKVINTNADIAYAAYSDSVTTAEALKTALDDFETDRSAENLEAAKEAWLTSREPYGQTEVYRFRPTPIEVINGEDGPEGDLNAWPLGEALIDYVKTGDDFDTDQIGVTAHSVEVEDGGTDLPASITVNNASNIADAAGNNIIQNTDVIINAALLANTASATDEHDVIAGYHAIEFLLWGQDLNSDNSVTQASDRTDAVNTGATGGQRPLTDFTTDTHADRRHAFLAIAVQKLIDDLTEVRDEWAPEIADNYRAEFTTLDSEADAKTKLEEILTGMGTLSEGELAGERMKIALNNNSQEDEHSCFSDNTHRDIWLNAEGVSNSYYGQYQGYDADLDPETVNISVAGAVDGYGIYDYMRDAGLENLAEDVKTAFDDTENKYTAIDTQARAGVPFDVLIEEGNTVNNTYVGDTIEALNRQANAIQVIADELGLGDVVDDEASACDTSSAGSVDGEEC